MQDVIQFSDFIIALRDDSVVERPAQLEGKLLKENQGDEYIKSMVDHVKRKSLQV